jgi:hypothetical protein
VFLYVTAAIVSLLFAAKCDQRTLYVEANGWDSCDILLELEDIKDGYTARSLLVVFQYSSKQCHYVLVLPAASNPNMSRRISLDPKILSRSLDTLPPILSVV